MKPEVETFQTTFELDQLVAIYDYLGPDRVLEIGCWKGGTLWHWLQAPGVTVVAVDDQMRDSDEWDDWALEAGSTLHTIQGNSHDDAVVHAAAELGPYEFMFIDADHSYNAVKADWENYGPMVAQGGVIVFHDIVPRPSYGVSDVWNLVKGIEGSRCIEITQNAVQEGSEGLCGIGVAWL